MIQEKLERLKAYLLDLESVAVAFSGGVDSTFLLKIAHDVLGSNMVAYTVQAGMVPEREIAFSREFCKLHGIPQQLIEVDEMQVEGFTENSRERCYFCKHNLFSKITERAKAAGFSTVCEGSNADDIHDYRPGMRALQGLGIRSPLLECKLTKADIRELSHQLDLPTWDKPSFACLASRIPYGEPISREKLSMISNAEQLLFELGFKQFRVRIHGENLARIEVHPEDFDTVLKNREQIFATFKNIGFAYISLDLQGYRTGSMNETLPNSFFLTTPQNVKPV